ncbi:MAG TPA: ABC-2 family transporter protein [Chloroflexota bacterium]
MARVSWWWRKQRALWSLSVQEALQYRLEGLIWFGFDLLPALTMVFLWLAVYQQRADVAGFDLGEMMAYYSGLIALRAIVITHPEWELARFVQEGTLAQWLTRPVSVWSYFLASGSAWRLLRGVFAVPAVVGIAALAGGEVALPVDAERIALLILALVQAFFLCFCIKMLLGMTAFWSTDSSGIFGLYEVVVGLLAGSILPLPILPAPVRAVAEALPFAYVYYFPLSILTEEASVAALTKGLLVQSAWLAVSLVAALFLWRVGLRRYEAMGG